MPLPREHLLDELATAYIQALAATAGAVIAVSRLDYGVDGTLSRVIQAKRKKSLGLKFIPDGFSVDFQLKGTTVAEPREKSIVYDLKSRNFDQIVTRPSTATPLYLFLVCFRNDSSRWITIEEDQLVLGASAFWWKQTGGSTGNSSTVRIKIPMTSRLTAAAIEDMLEASKNRFRSQ